MQQLFDKLFPYDALSHPYQSPAEYLGDLIAMLDLRLTFALRYYHDGGRMVGDPLERFKGMVVTRTEVEDLVEAAPRPLDLTQLSRVLDMARLHIGARRSMTEPEHLVFDYVQRKLDLSDFESFAMLLGLLCEADRKYEKIIAYLQDDVTLKGPTWDLAVKLYHMPDTSRTNPALYSMALEAYTHMALCLLERPCAFGTGELIRIDPRMAEYILSGGDTLLEENGIRTLMPNINNPPLPAMEGELERLERFVLGFEERPLYVYLYGPAGSGRRSRLSRLCDRTDRVAIACDCRELSRDIDRLETVLYRACREAYLNDGYIVFEHTDTFTEDEQLTRWLPMMLECAGKFSDTVFGVGESEWRQVAASAGLHFIKMEVTRPDIPDSEALWGHYLGDWALEDGVTPSLLASTFQFVPGQIKGASMEARRLMLMRGGEALSRDDIREGAYAQIVHKLGDKATRIVPKYTFEDMILPPEQKRMLKSACDQIRFKSQVYDAWGLGKRITYGRGVSMLFAGLPGTGKTMAAQVVAGEMGLVLYKIDLSQIASKYIGETEKNLAVVFSEAQKSNAILFFDETDALLGKRTEVKDSHDKYSNFETAYLLQKMEEYDGITIMSTNLLENIDSAFFRRISYIVHFPFPDVSERERIWRGMIPAGVPIEGELDFGYLARQFEIAGGNIKNTAVTAAFLAAATGESLGLAHVLTALRYELTKQGKVLLREDFGEYAYLIY